MFFSICVAVYNASLYLRESVNSILNQSFQDFEIILVDDASTDGSGGLCDEIARNYPDKVRVIHHESNKGELLARRTFFENAQGDWFLSVDADDKLLDGALEKIYDTIDQFKCDLVLYDLDCYHLDGHIEKFTVPLKEMYIYSGDEKKKVYEQIGKSYYINSICTKAIHKSIVDFDVDYTSWGELRFGTDIFLSYPIFDSATSIVYRKEPLYAYIKRDDAITTKWHNNWYSTRRILWLRDREYRMKWNMGEEYNCRAAINYVKRTVFYLDGQFDLTPAFKDIRKWYELLYKDGDIAECIKTTTRMKKRHLMYAKAICAHHFRALHAMQRIFHIAKRFVR